jgi:hypothetical protein
MRVQSLGNPVEINRAVCMGGVKYTDANSRRHRRLGTKKPSESGKKQINAAHAKESSVLERIAPGIILFLLFVLGSVFAMWYCANCQQPYS